MFVDSCIQAQFVRVENQGSASTDIWTEGATETGVFFVGPSTTSTPFKYTLTGHFIRDTRSTAR